MTKICWEDPGEPLEMISSCSSTRNADSIVNKKWIDRNSTALQELGNKISVVDEPQMGHNNQSIGTSQLPWLSRSLLLLPFDPFFAMFVLSLSSILRILEICTAMRERRLKMTQREALENAQWEIQLLAPPTSVHLRARILAQCILWFVFMLHDDVNRLNTSPMWNLTSVASVASKSSKLRFLWSLLLRQDFIIVIGTDVQCRMRPRSWRQCSHRWL